MTKKKQLYEGKAKVIFEGPEAGTLVQHFKDDATAFNAQLHQRTYNDSGREFRHTGAFYRPPQ